MLHKWQLVIVSLFWKIYYGNVKMDTFIRKYFRPMTPVKKTKQNKTNKLEFWFIQVGSGMKWFLTKSWKYCQKGPKHPEERCINFDSFPPPKKKNPKKQEFLLFPENSHDCYSFHFAFLVKLTFAPTGHE